MANINDSFDIYNTNLLKDKPTVDLIVEAIKVELEAKMLEEVNHFAYHLVPVIGALPQIQQNRIVDSVIYILRKAGIRVQLNGSNLDDPNYNAINYYYPHFNGVNTAYEYLYIIYFNRNSTEYMKTYV